MQNRENNKVFYGGFFARLAAAWVDALLVACFLLTLRIPVWLTSMGSSYLYQLVLFNFTAWDILLYLLGSAYYIILTYMTGTTLGKRIFSLEVVAADERKLSFWDVLYRETIGKYLSGAFLCIGYIMAGIDKEKRAFHDILCDTRVIYSFGKEPRPESVYGEAENYNRNDSGIYRAADYGYRKPEPPSDTSETDEEKR